MNYGIGVLMLIVGIYFLVMDALGLVVIRFWSICFGLIFLLTGFSMLIFEFGFRHGFPTYFPQDFSGRALAMGIGVLCCSVFVMNIWKIITCKEKIMAEYTGCRTIHNYRGLNTYMPVFSYEWEREHYYDIESQSSFPRWRIMKYQSGSMYRIYINPHHPKVITVVRRPSIRDVSLLFFGTMLVMFACL